MKALTSLVILTASIAVSAAQPTGNEMVLLRMTIRQEMTTDGQSFAPASALVPAWGPPDNREFWGDGPMPYVGVFADNGTAFGAPSVNASFDFFEVRALP